MQRFQAVFIADEYVHYIPIQTLFLRYSVINIYLLLTKPAQSSGQVLFLYVYGPRLRLGP